jgi:ABC-type polysaccharide/polyol phosphate export permease
LIGNPKSPEQTVPCMFDIVVGVIVYCTVNRIVVHSCKQIVHSANITKHIPLRQCVVLLLCLVFEWAPAKHKLLVMCVDNKRNVAHIDRV